ncbi:hypothetical protein BDQ12DRAFT_670656 [Crucibulum laeve]|uniref:Uncharacterized protein n=1 Tax=Crucibulum laeve TaxID=68775 RepID=A0A5C3LJN0_9AGAR|nr:hypothetical protein BDQ12DRAFT_670656 [Crucibulum laeve]
MDDLCTGGSRVGGGRGETGDNVLWRVTNCAIYRKQLAIRWRVWTGGLELRDICHVFCWVEGRTTSLNGGPWFYTHPRGRTARSAGVLLVIMEPAGISKKKIRLGRVGLPAARGERTDAWDWTPNLASQQSLFAIVKTWLQSALGDECVMQQQKWNYSNWFDAKQLIAFAIRERTDASVSRFQGVEVLEFYALLTGGYTLEWLEASKMSISYPSAFCEAR